MASHTGSSHGQLIGVGGARERPFNIVTNFGPDMIAKAQSNDWYGETTNFRIAVSNQHVAKGHYDPILHEAHYDAAIETLESRDYVDWCEEISSSTTSALWGWRRSAIGAMAAPPTISAAYLRKRPRQLAARCACRKSSKASRPNCLPVLSTQFQ